MIDGMTSTIFHFEAAQSPRLPTEMFGCSNRCLIFRWFLICVIITGFCRTNGRLSISMAKVIRGTELNNNTPYCILVIALLIANPEVAWCSSAV
jgi:hypothetical protein